MNRVLAAQYDSVEGVTKGDSHGDEIISCARHVGSLDCIGFSLYRVFQLRESSIPRLSHVELEHGSA
jgi:hypothetical protein